MHRDGAAVLAVVAAASAQADARPYLSGSEACQQGREIARDHFQAWGRMDCSAYRADRYGRRRSDVVFVYITHNRQNARYQWALTLRIRETSQWYWWTKKYWVKMGPMY